MRSYNLNNLIEVRVAAPVDYLAYFNNEYERISREPSGQSIPVVTLRVVHRLERSDVREIIFKGLFRFRYALQNLETTAPQILFERHWLDRLYITPVGAFIQGQLLEPVIYKLLLERGVLFMHAAGVARDGKAFVFPAHGGTGKTTLALSLARKGYELLGDDLLMVDVGSGIVYPYARPLHLFTYNLRTMSVPIGLRFAIYTKDLVRWILTALSGQRFLISTRAHVDDLMPVRFGKPSQLARVVFLQRDGEPKTMRLTDPDARRLAAETIIASADLNESLFANITEDRGLRSREMDVVTRLLERISQLEFINPRQMNESARARFADALQEGKSVDEAVAA